jgi:type III pantothenate kinase
MTRLLLDAGNTRLKWAVGTGDRWQAQGAAHYDDLAPLAAWHAPQTQVYVASVTNDENERRLRSWFEAAGMAVRWLGAEAVFGEVRNAYTVPERLGVDRWMALIAARARSRAASLVVSAGTALTIDALSAAGEFMGGLVVPGGNMMRTALQEGTARVGHGEGQWQDFPRRTEDAVETGIVAALCGAIASQYDRLARAAGDCPHCFLTGGDAIRLLPHLGMAVEHVPALVLEGIDCVARKEASA